MGLRSLCAGLRQNFRQRSLSASIEDKLLCLARLVEHEKRQRSPDLGQSLVIEMINSPTASAFKTQNVRKRAA